MTNEEAVQACEFWTTDIAETKAIGTTLNPMVGLHFDGDQYQRSRWLNPDRVGWSLTIPRSSPVYELIVAEIARRHGSST
jgi:hypothetical protein